MTKPERVAIEDQKVYAVTESGKIYWNKRNSLGQFVRADGTNSSDRAWTLSAWHAYLAARMADCERVIRCHYATVDGYRRGVRFASFFKVGASLRLASQEVRDWFEENGPTLSYSAFRAQTSLVA